MLVLLLRLHHGAYYRFDFRLNLSPIVREETEIADDVTIYFPLTILQASILKMYPAEIIVVAFYCLFVMIQSSVVTLIAERDLNAWRIETKIGLIAIFFSVRQGYDITLSIIY